MAKIHFPAFALLALAIPACAQDASLDPAAPIERVLVVGQLPGPALWRVSKDGHVMWLFGTYSPLPRQMVWRSQQVENALAQSTALLAPPASGISVGWGSAFNIVTTLPFLVGVKKNADGAHLQDVVPADVYARWSVLKQKYLPNDRSIEEERPMFAADTLFQKGIYAVGMDRGNAVSGRIFEMAKNWKIKIVNSDVTVPLDNPRQAVRDFKKTRFEDLECFTKTIDRLESDLDAMRVRANAWSKGDIAAIRKLDFPDQSASCNAAVLDSKWMGGIKGAADLHQRAAASWLAAVDKTVAANAFTFALLPIHEINKPDGLLATLRTRGYTVDEPD